MHALKPFEAGPGAELEALTHPVFDRRLSPEATTPIAVAYSGGGDSLAALLAARAWADRLGRPVLALHVDHGLQADSRRWAAQAGRTANSLGVGFQVLDWTGSKPGLGLAAAARRARHILIAEAARAAGARVVVFGHTADDRIESDLMREQGSSLGWLAEWGPSPAWPQGRGVFLLRPLLDLRRAQIRRLLAPYGLDWIEDPANGDPRFTRARARLDLAGADRAAVPLAIPADLASLAQAARCDLAGAVRLERRRLNQASSAAARRWLSAALVSVGGGERPPRRARLEALLARLAGAGAVIATLAGVQLNAEDEIVLIREAGSYRRHGAPRLVLAPGDEAVWDGRFLFANRGTDEVEVRPLMGLAATLPKDQRAALLQWPPGLRPSLPAALGEGESTTCPILAGDGALKAKCLVSERLNGACGVISLEPAT